MSIYSTLAQGGFNAATAGLSYIINDALQTKARDENYMYNEMAARNADQRTRALYHDLYSIKAQMQNAKEAGLSPSIFYQGQGTIGQGGAQGNGAGGIGAPYIPVSPVDMAGIELAKAQAEKTRAETQNVQEDTITKKLNNYITSSNANESIEQAKLTTQTMSAELQKTIAETENIQWHTDFNKITQNEQIQNLINKNNETLSRIVLNESSTKLNDRERKHFDHIVDKWQMDVYQKFVELDIYQQSVNDQNDWFDEQALNLKNVLTNAKEQFNQQLKLNRTSMWLDFSANILKNVVYGTGLIMTGGLSGIGSALPATGGYQNGKIGFK